MVIDHVNLTLLGASRPDLFLIGRLTFPLFCYALAVALFKAKDGKGTEYALRRYAPRLLLFALVTEPIARFSRDVDVINVMFTLAFGAAMAGVSLRLKDLHVALLCAGAIALMYFPPLFEFSAAGVMLPTAFLMVLRGRALGIPCLIALLAFTNLGNFGDLFADTSLRGVIFFGIIALVCIVPPILLIRYAAANVPQTGRYLPKYFLHIFYPAHLLAIWAVGRYIFHLPV